MYKEKIKTGYDSRKSGGCFEKDAVGRRLLAIYICLDILIPLLGDDYFGIFGGPTALAAPLSLASGQALAIAAKL